jgi:hypothetical protein
VYFDKYNFVALDQCGFPGNIGDSCAETCRLINLQRYIGENPVTQYANLFNFITPNGFLRHPDAPEGWRENDFSSDQALPFLLAARSFSLSYLVNTIEKRIKEDHWKTGNGDFVSPLFYASLKDSDLLKNITLLGQAALFKMPWRWSDEHNKFEENSESSADYLNWINVAIHQPQWVRNLISKEKLFDKVTKYYASEPQALAVAAYSKALNKGWV